MLRKIVSLPLACLKIDIVAHELRKTIITPTVIRNFKALWSLRTVCDGILGQQTSRSFHYSLPRNKREDRREMLASMPVREDGTDGEKSIDIDSLIKREESVFPDEHTPTTLFNGIPFREVPVCNIRVSPNNTIMSITDHKGIVKLLRSCGMEGFKHSRKGTNIAAQATAISLCVKALERGFKTVRVRVRGLGPGRMSAIKGLQMGGLNIISVTDSTPVSWKPLRARKQRRL